MRWLTILLGSFLATAQAQQFVTRSENRLHEGTKLYYVLGGNAHYLMTAAATGDTVAVDEVFANAKSLGLTVIRKWGFSIHLTV